MTHENTFGQNFCHILRNQGALIYNLVGSQYNSPGWPDKLVIHRMWTGFVELKAKTTRVEKAQCFMHNRIIERRFPIVIVRDLGAAIRIIYNSGEEESTLEKFLSCVSGLPIL